jgi:hypothetical protein
MKLPANDAWRIIRSVLQIVGAAAIGFFFVVVVMVATAQQDVLTRMKAEGLSVGYSSTLALRSEAKAKSAAIPQLEANERKLSFGLGEAQSKLEQAQHDLDLAWDAFRPSASRLNRANLCDISQPATDTPNTRIQITTEVQQCRLDDASSAGAARLLNAAQQQASRFDPSARAYLDASEQLSTMTRQLAYTRGRLLASRSLTVDQQKAVSSFGDMDVLLQPWVLSGNALVQFPPPLLQFLLTYVSGLFGALLITLILIVYPSNLVTKAADARPVTRTFLGGFIALSVYIVLLSGTALLGSANSGTGAGTNYMAFCGIGILAGMFSDRVAGWLSKQADQFFKQ